MLVLMWYFYQWWRFCVLNVNNPSKEAFQTLRTSRRKAWDQNEIAETCEVWAMVWTIQGRSDRWRTQSRDRSEHGQRRDWVWLRTMLFWSKIHTYIFSPMCTNMNNTQNNNHNQNCKWVLFIWTFSRHLTTRCRTEIKANVLIKGYL